MPEGRTKKALLNIGSNFINQVVVLVLGFVSRRIFLTTIGVEYLGLNGLFADILGMLSMADLGFNIAMVYSFYKPLSENDFRKISALITFYKKIYNYIAIGVAVVGISLIPFLKYIINLDNEIDYVYFYYLISLSNVIISYLFVYKTTILTADQRNYIIVRNTTIMTIIRTVLQILAMLLFESFALFLFITTITNFINNFIVTKKAIKLYPFIKDKEKLSGEEKKDIFSNLKSVFIFKAAIVLMNTTDNIIISSIIGTVAVGLYSSYLMVSTRITALFALFFTSLVSSIGNVIVTTPPEKRYSIFKIEQCISFVICGILIPCFFLMIEDLIGVWLGEEYQLGLELQIAVSLNLYLSCILQPLWTYREATGIYKKTKWGVVAAAVLNILLSIIGGSLIGLPGVVFASALSRLLTYFWYEPIVLFRDFFDTHPKKYYLGILFNLILVISISFLMYLYVKDIVIKDWCELLIKGCCCFAIAFLVTLPLYYKTEGFQALITHIKCMQIFKQ